jgi:AcrR family transcriptional regulator
MSSGDSIAFRENDRPNEAAATAAESKLDASVKTRLFQALEELLADHHPDAISLRQIARSAGVSHGLPGYYFGDRAGLLTAYAAEGYALLAERIEKVAAAAVTPADCMAAIGIAYIDFSEDRSTYFSVMFQSHEVDANDAALKLHADRCYNPFLKSMETYFAAHPERRARQGVVTVGAWAIVHGAAMLARGPRLKQRVPPHLLRPLFAEMCRTYASTNMPED